MTMPAPVSEDESRWCAFLRLPGGYAHPQRLAETLGGAMTPDLCAALQAEPRFAARLTALLDTAGLVPPAGAALDCADVDRSIAVRGPHELTAAALRAGALYWADAIANVVLAPDVEALRRSLDGDLIAFGLANRAAGAQGLRFDDLTGAAEVVARDGWYSFLAWVAQLPAAVAGRLMLKFEDGAITPGPVPDPFGEIGPGLYRQAAG
ncbi:hypothetical protein BOQ54_16440 [Chelatococcus daeguensis]|uniref:Uncharacterized protein n=1 Tax=Chelatococcus daeguensis TaxID=444444 RepID=A0AAC9JS13_9HYPH|nr:hypothetical protein [Chelatococcus daeguensis]APF38713.1 hypothetical protein BOQ54_16440 [Chelatococcus daeguensis]